MKVDRTTGLVSAARQQPSPNCDARPQGAAPELLVVHGISLPPGRYGGPYIDQLFTNRLDAAAHEYFADIAHLRVSAHLLVRRDGSLVQYVPLHKRAWHAGQSIYCGREACNDFSIGIELEGSDEEPYGERQYETLSRLYVALSWAYPELANHPVVGHSDIAPGRKTDPGPCFDWSRMATLVTELGGQMASRAEFSASLA